MSRRPANHRCHRCTSIARAAVVALVLSLGAPPQAAAKRASNQLSPLIQPDRDAARADLVEAFGEVSATIPRLPADAHPILAQHAAYTESSGLGADAPALAAYVDSMEEGLAMVDVTMLRVITDASLGLLMGHIYTLETLEQLQPLGGDHQARLLDDYGILWTYIGLFPSVAELTRLEEQTGCEVGPALRARAAWAEGLRPVVWDALAARLVWALQHEQDVAETAERLGGEASGIGRTLWRSRDSEQGKRIFLAGLRYRAAADPSPEIVAALLYNAVHADGPEILPKPKKLPDEVLQHPDYHYVDDALAKWRELAEAEEDDSVEGEIHEAATLYALDRESDARERLLGVLRGQPGHTLALARLASTYAESSPGLAHAVMSLTDPADPELDDEYWERRFPIEWNHLWAVAAPMMIGETTPEILAAVDHQLATIAQLVSGAGTRAPKARAYSGVLEDALRQMWLDGRGIDDVDLDRHLPLLEQVSRDHPDPDLYRLLLFVAVFSKVYEDVRICGEPISPEFDEATRCQLHAQRIRFVIGTSTDGLDSPRERDVLQQEIEAMEALCGTSATTHKFRGDLAVIRSTHGEPDVPISNAVPSYEACVADDGIPLTVTCLGNLVVVRQAAGQPAEARAAFDRLWEVGPDAATTIFHGLQFVDEGERFDVPMWVEVMLQADETANETDRIHMCAGERALLQGDSELAEQHWQLALDLLEADCDGDDVRDCLPGLMAGHGSAGMRLTGRSATPIAVDLELHRLLLRTCDEGFLRWVEQGGGATDPQP